MKKNRWIGSLLPMILPFWGVLALAQYTVPEPPKLPQFTPPAASQPVENIAVMELRIGLQKAQIQSALADRVVQLKEDALKTLQARVNAATADQEMVLNAQVEAIAARAAADSAKIDVASMDVQYRAGPAALQQAQTASMQQQGPFIPPANPLMAQLMQMELRKAQIQATAAAQVVPIKQKIYDLLAAQQQAGIGAAEKVTDALVDLEAAKAGQQSAALDEQLMMARMAAAGVRG